MTLDEIKQKVADLKARMPLNAQRLDVEAHTQAAFYVEVGELNTELKHLARISKNNLEFVKNKIKKDIRENPGKYGIAKLSNDAVEEACVISEEYQKAQTEATMDQYLADQAAVLLEAAAQRKSTLRDAVSLMLREYYMTAKDMYPEQRSIAKVNEDEVLKHRRELATQRLQDNKNEESEIE